MMKFKKVRNEGGYVTVPFLLFAAILTPIILFLVIEITQSYSAKSKIEMVADNMAKAGVWQIDEEELKEGEIVLDINKSQASVNNLLASEFGEGTGQLDSMPIQDVAINERATETSRTVRTEGVQFQTSGPSVFIGLHAYTKPIFLPPVIEVRAAQGLGLRWRDKVDKTYTGSLSFGSLSASKVVNPAIYDRQDWPVTSPDLHMASGGNVSVSVSVSPSNPEKETAEVKMLFVGGDHSLSFGNSASFTVPEDAPIGSMLVVEAIFTSLEDGSTREESAVIGQVTHELKKLLITERIHPK
ncbi:hypothetical protein [Psychrobacillus sp. FSL K6-1464]|uniref:hypothetical protein n=1 Tax=Psychrobacillus sp. FSL K6-1464 TaxID=2921545 RepID=UPI0030F600A6